MRVLVCGGKGGGKKHGVELHSSSSPSIVVCTRQSPFHNTRPPPRTWENMAWKMAGAAC